MLYSILTSIKKMLNIAQDDTSFDADIIIYINGAFLALCQMGIGPSSPFSIEDETAEWEDFSDDPEIIAGIKPFIYLKTRKVFDPPASSSAIESLEAQLKEYEWRLYSHCNFKITTE